MGTIRSLRTDPCLAGARKTEIEITEQVEDMRDFNSAATMIQAQARGREAREDFRDQRGAAVHIQAVLRGNRVRAEYPELAGNRKRLRTGEKRKQTGPHQNG